MADEYKSIYSGQEVDNAVATAQKALTTDNLVQTTGPSPNNVMSQSAVTAAIQNIKSGTTVTVNNVAQTTWNADTKINVFQGVENAGKTFMVGQDGNAVLQTVDTSGGIIQLVGTTSNPINFATSMEVGQLYSCSGVFNLENTLGLFITIGIQNPPAHFLIYKFLPTEVLILDASLNRITINLIMGPSTNSTVAFSFNDKGQITNYSTGIKLASLNGNINDLAISIYAPITSGTSGQILQSNGDGNAPTWVDNKSGLNLEHSEFMPEDYGDIWSALDDSFVEMRTNYGNNLANVSCQDGYAVLTAYNSVIDKTVEFRVFADENQQNAGISINIHNNQTSTDTNVTLTEEGFKYNGNQILTSETGMEKTNIENLSIDTTNWSALSDSSPYTYSATVTAITNISDNSVVELINNQAVLFATYGFAIGSISGQNITIYSIGQPSTSVTLTVGVTG